MSYIQKIPHSKVLNLREEVPVEKEQVASMTLVQRQDLGMTILSLDKDQEIGGHSSKGDAMVNLLSGQARITIGDEVFVINAGETIIMPANIKHALYAVEAFQMLLVVVKPEGEL
ncbi:cupin domain-containing protein [Enterococcus sp. BWT-B8]|uniref:cupin domain-containing protein n=1 Tax=unclassified Enterococcus TaxID=2608891 RepID=UPI001E454E48|nr:MULTISPECIES: cupin domain-containing protein [unclassified Enterococcus]MCB5951749.1 cupin domain-containing protein [Enterococcus sp. BWT-B8]MCB5953916.1 cupin domain-containing protein [Enterococcus sp. CWB-B31]